MSKQERITFRSFDEMKGKTVTFQLPKAFVESVVKLGMNETRNYRYHIVYSFSGRTYLRRIRREHLGTEAAQSCQRPDNPNGWQLLWCVDGCNGYLP